MKDAYAACHRGSDQETYIIGEYKTGGNSFAAKWMRDNIHSTDIVFNAAAHSPKVSIQGWTDGIYFDGTTMFIIEMKSGKRYAKKHYAQVVRYAMAMMHTTDYINVEMYIVYSDIEEVDTFKFNVKDIPAEYARVKGDEGTKGKRNPKRVASEQTIANRKARKQLTKLRGAMKWGDWTLPDSELTVENVIAKMIDSVERHNGQTMDAETRENYIIGTTRSFNII